MTTGEKLTAARGARSREEVADGVGITVTAVTKYETGAREPRDEVKVRLADYYGATVQSLFFDDVVTNRVNFKNTERKKTK